MKCLLLENNRKHFSVRILRTEICMKNMGFCSSHPKINNVTTRCIDLRLHLLTVIHEETVPARRLSYEAPF